MARFPKGVSGNPAGRPKGAKTRKTLMLEALQRHSPLKGRAAEIDSMIKLCFSKEPNTREQAFNLLRHYIEDAVKC